MIDKVYQESEELNRDVLGWEVMQKKSKEIPGMSEDWWICM